MGRKSILGGPARHYDGVVGILDLLPVVRVQRSVIRIHRAATVAYRLVQGGQRHEEDRTVSARGCDGGWVSQGSRRHMQRQRLR